VSLWLSDVLYIPPNLFPSTPIREKLWEELEDKHLIDEAMFRKHHAYNGEVIVPVCDELVDYYLSDHVCHAQRTPCEVMHVGDDVWDILFEYVLDRYWECNDYEYRMYYYYELVYWLSEESSYNVV